MAQTEAQEFEEFFAIPLREADLQMIDSLSTDEEAIEYIWSHLLGEVPFLDEMVDAWLDRS